ncbi:MAG: methionyl-tRNA formyltransferase [Parcubacteria group bacterium]|nr:methionyl-tRNA formyltransferase [Parcubacteria group bacterium]
MIHDSKISFVFFGTDEFSIIVLEELKKAGFVPALIVTATNKKMGRGMRLTPPPVKLWAQKNNIPFLQPEKLDDVSCYKLKTNDYGLFIVASYGKIIPKRILDIPTKGALNVHPSLLPLYRGPSPIESQILDGADEREATGATIILMDEKMDHGPILASRVLEFPISNFQFPNKPHITNKKLWETRGKDGPCPPEEDPPSADEIRPVLARVFHSMTSPELHDALAHLGGALLAETIPKWLAGEITPQEQEHEKATYTKKITKEDGQISLDDDPKTLHRKFRAFASWPSLYFFDEKKLRVKITDAELRDDKFIIKKIIPEGKKETNYETWRIQQKPS